MAVYLFDRDPETGAVETFEYDEANGVATIHRREDVEPNIEANKRELLSGHSGYTPSRDMRRAASIPCSVALEWKQKLGIDVFDKNDWPAVKRLLNSNEWAYLRTAEFTL